MEMITAKINELRAAGHEVTFQNAWVSSGQTRNLYAFVVVDSQLVRWCFGVR